MSRIETVQVEELGQTEPGRMVKVALNDEQAIWVLQKGFQKDGAAKGDFAWMGRRWVVLSYEPELWPDREIRQMVTMECVGVVEPDSLDSAIARLGILPQELHQAPMVRSEYRCTPSGRRAITKEGTTES